MLYVLLDDEIKQGKPPTLINWAIFAAIIGPIWLNVLENIFQEYINTLTEALTFFLAATLIIIMTMYIMNLSIESLKEFMNLRYIKLKKLKKLKSLIKEIEFEWLNENKLSA